MSTDKLELYKVHKVQELKRQNRRDEARDILERVSKQVQPILRKRQWTVPLLREFLPKNPNLLGLNKNGGRGKTMEINVRLRYHHSPDAFYPYEDILGTMLHEITHNVRGPHDAQFYSILDELTKECEDLMAKGVSGTGIGFDGPSMGRLGAHSWMPTHNPPTEALRDAQLKAAKQRAAQQAVMCQGPQRLGGSLGSASLRHLSASEAAARAAERRSRDDLRCPSAAIAAGDKIVIDLLDEDSDDDEGGNGVNNPGAIPRSRAPLGARAGSSNKAAKNTAVNGAAGVATQLGKFTGKLVPGFPARSSGMDSRAGASTARRGQAAGPGAAVGVGGILCEPDTNKAGASSAGGNSSRAHKAAQARNLQTTVDVVDLINSPCDMCCGRQRTAFARESGQHKTVDLICGDVELTANGSTSSAPSKRARAAKQTKSDVENSEGTGKGPKFIDLT